MGFQLSYFNPKRWCCESAALNMPANLENSAVAKKTGKCQFSLQSQRKAIPKNSQTITQLHSSHTLVKWCLKFSKPGFNSTGTVNFQIFKLILEKAEEPEIKLPTSAGSSQKQESSRKTSISPLLTVSKPFTVWITINCGKFWKRWEYQTTWSAFLEICMQVKKQQLELNMEQQTGSKYEKEYVKAVYWNPAYLTSMQSTSWETLGCMKQKLESRLPGEISITSDTQMTPPLWQKLKKN